MRPVPEPPFRDAVGMRNLARVLDQRGDAIAALARRAHARAQATVYQGPAARRFLGWTDFRLREALRVAEELNGLSAMLIRAAAGIEHKLEEERRLAERRREAELRKNA